MSHGRASDAGRKTSRVDMGFEVNREVSVNAVSEPLGHRRDAHDFGTAHGAMRANRANPNAETGFIVIGPKSLELQAHADDRARGQVVGRDGVETRGPSAFLGRTSHRGYCGEGHAENGIDAAMASPVVDAGLVCTAIVVGVALGSRGWLGLGRQFDCAAGGVRVVKGRVAAMGRQLRARSAVEVDIVRDRVGGRARRRALRDP